MKMNKKIFLVIALAGFALTVSTARASVVSGTHVDVAGTTGTNVNITAAGTLDWAYWDTSASSGISLPTNSKNGGTAISDASTVGGGTGRGSSSDTEAMFTFTDGTSLTSGTAPGSGFGVSGIFNNQLGSINTGISLAITLPTTDMYTIYLWTAEHRATGQLTVSLNGATSYIAETTDTLGPNPKTSYLYTLTAKADTIGDVLNIELLTTATDGNAYSTSVISGVAISAVPEPATIGMLGLGTLVAVLIRRTRK
jgi:hypothetical protein